MSNRENKVEVLAPAGSYDIMTAVIKAGADAVYLGGDMFGARAYAGNFNNEELIRAIEYAHLHDRKIYMTVNTLVKEKELEGRLVEYLTPFYEAGLDAVIVQDLGVFRTIHEHFPDMDIHASTQMAITGRNGAALMKEMGASRVVTARELNATEIKDINDHVDIEIESFVHGALCYCYSGQCLFSSMNGGRSGNRGRCAQPCRMNYQVHENDGPKLNDNKSQYALSPKDMCALPILPDVIDAGVYSLKIEGRMKNVTYAAGVTSLYRKYVDMYLEKGRKGYHVSEQDIHDLMDLYNRGAFSEGYYKNSKGRDMISLSRPNHMGTKALSVLNNVNGRVTFKALERIYPQDVFEIDSEHSFSSGADYQTGDTFEVNLPKKYRLNKGMTLFRTRNKNIVDRVNDKYVETRLKKAITAKVTAYVGSPMKLELSDGKVSVSLEGQIIDPAMKQPVTEEKLKEQFSKLGDTEFEMESITVDMQGDGFFPVGQINSLRREAVSALEHAICSQYTRSYQKPKETDMFRVASDEKETDIVKVSERKTGVLVTTQKQLEYVSTLSQVSYLYLDYMLLNQQGERSAEWVEKCHDNGKEIYLALPYVLRDKNLKKFTQLIELSQSIHIDGYLVRNLEEFGVLADWMKDSDQNRGHNGLQSGTDQKLKIIPDAGLYVWNQQAAMFYHEMAMRHGIEIQWLTLPYEQTSRELSQIEMPLIQNQGRMKKELVVYTRLPLMLSEQCVRKTFGKCDGSNGNIVITDRKNQDYLVKSYCSYCYTIIYDSSRMDLTDMQEEIDALDPDLIRFELIDDSIKEEEINQILSGESTGKDVSKGHFVLGVE